MGIRSHLLHTIFLLLVLLAPGGIFATNTQASTGNLPTPEILQAKIEEVEAATGLTDTVKSKMTELYRKALGNLETISANNAKAEAFRTAAVSAPQDTQATLEKFEQVQKITPEDSLATTEDIPLDQLELLLQKEKADLAAVEAKLADLDTQLENESTRPDIVRNRLTEAKGQQEQIATELGLPSPSDESPALTEARQWSLATREQVLRAEIRMLDQELLSQPQRVGLLKARQDLATHSVSLVRSRVRLLEDAVNQRRQVDLASVQDETEAAIREYAGKHPVLVQLAEKNAVLGDQLTSTARELERVSTEDDEIKELATQIEQEFKNTREALKIAGLSQSLGQVFLEQLRSLPDLRSFRRQLRDREKKIAEYGLSRMRNKEQNRKLRDLNVYAEALLDGESPEDAGQVRTEMQMLLETRRELTGKLLALEERILREFGLAEIEQRRLIEIVEDYDDFLGEHLLWVRTSNLAQLGDFASLPAELARFISPRDWLDVTRVLMHQVPRSPVFALIILGFAILMWKRRGIIDALQATGEGLDNPTTDSFAVTAKAVLLTLLAGVAWPMLATGAGWQLHHSLEATGFTGTIGIALIAVSAQFYFLQFSRALCLPDGLAARHFRWPGDSVALLRRELGRLLWTFLPAAFLTYVAINLDPVTLGGMIGRLSFLIIAYALGLFFFRVLHPRTGVLVDFLQATKTQPLGWIHRLWFPLLAFMPAVLGLLALSGYLHTAGSLITHLIQTTWMIFGLIVLNGLAVRWLMVTRRRLAYEAALEGRTAESEMEQIKDSIPDDDSTPIEVEEPEVDLVALSEESRKLLNATLVFIGIIGLWLVWSEVLPALRFLNQVSLWHYTVTVDDETQRLPITLADIGLAILIAIGTAVLARRLPSVLEIVLLNRVEMSAGGRYTIITLTTYVIVAIGILLFLSTIGARWSQLQWLVAALGVGIGFGLQEIVANFISGLIILFERPIRVGDIVTVGDTDGVVTRIRIRATTIRNWDRKELLVPNKEFITGRLLNWSLSDQITRVVIVVGVAYGSDVDKALELMRKAAEEHEHVLDDPEPVLSFEGFGDNSLTLLLRAYLGSLEFRLATITDLHRAINTKFNEAGITIAFPQRDIHLDTSSPLKIQVAQEAGQGK